MKTKMPSKREQYLKDKAAYEADQEARLSEGQKSAGSQARSNFQKVPYEEYLQKKKEAEEPSLMDQLGKMWDDAFEGSGEPTPHTGASEQWSEELHKNKQRNTPPKKNPYAIEPITGAMNEEEVELDEDGKPIRARKDLLSKMRMPVA